MRMTRRLAAALEERAYALPSNGTMVMYDLYALYALWWEVGSGRESYGTSSYARTVPVNAMRAKAVDQAFETCVLALAHRMVEELKHLIYDEAQNCCDEYLVEPESLDAWLQNEASELEKAFVGRNELEAGMHCFELVPEKEFWQKAGLTGAWKIFAAKFWEECDMYGGEAWCVITAGCMNLLGKIKHDAPIKSILKAIDEIYDLEHNTGAVFNKSGCSLKVSKANLDNRAGIRKVQDFLPLVSSHVAAMITSAKNILPESFVAADAIISARTAALQATRH